MTGSTQGIRFRISPPKNAESSTAANVSLPPALPEIIRTLNGSPPDSSAEPCVSGVGGTTPDDCPVFGSLPEGTSPSSASLAASEYLPSRNRRSVLELDDFSATVKVPSKRAPSGISHSESVQDWKPTRPAIGSF